MSRTCNFMVVCLLALDVTAVYAEDAKFGYLGISYGDAPGERGCATIEQVAAGSPAAGVPLRAHDILLAIDDSPVRVSADVDMGRFPPGKKVQLTILRDGKELQLSAVLGTRPNFAQMLRETDPPRVPGGEMQLSDDGFMGTLQNSGNLILSPNAGVVHGGFEQSWTGLLDVRIKDRDAYPSLVVQGDVKLSGILYVDLALLEPRAGDQFEVIRGATSIEGEFGKLMLPTLPRGLRWKVVYDNLKKGIDHNGNHVHDVTLLVVKDGSAYD